MMWGKIIQGSKKNSALTPPPLSIMSFQITSSNIQVGVVGEKGRKGRKREEGGKEEKRIL